jgi:hypothetical protein
MDWHQLKEWLVAWTGLDMDALHVHAGLLLLVAAALVTRRPLRSPWPWLVVLAAELANEYYDYSYEIWPTRDEQFAESVRDVWNTMLVPSAVFVIARWFPVLLVGRGPRSASDPGEAGGETG